MLKTAAAATAGIGAVAAGAKYVHLAAAGRVFPFAPVTLHEDPNGTYRKDKCNVPTRTIDWYLPHDVDLRKRAQEEMGYLEQRSAHRYRTEYHTKPLRLSVWSSAVRYYMDWIDDMERTCLVVTGKHVSGVYLETIVQNTLS